MAYTTGIYDSSGSQKSLNQGARLYSLRRLHRRLPLLVSSCLWCSLLSLAHGPSSTFRGSCLTSFISFSLRFCFILTSSSLILTLLLPSSSYKDYCGRIRTTQIIQYNLPVSRSLTNICRVPFAITATYSQVLKVRIGRSYHSVCHRNQNIPGTRISNSKQDSIMVSCIEVFTHTLI